MERDFARPSYEPEPVDERPRPRRSGKQATLLLLAAFVLGPALWIGGRLALADRDLGQITFSSQATDCTVAQDAVRFPVGSTIYATVILERGVSPGEILTATVSKDGVTLATGSITVEGAGTCWSELLDEGTLERGQYAVAITAGTEVLAIGSFEVT